MKVSSFAKLFLSHFLVSFLQEGDCAQLCLIVPRIWAYQTLASSVPVPLAVEVPKLINTLLASRLAKYTKWFPRGLTILGP